MRSGSAHCDLELADEVPQCPLRSAAGDTEVRQFPLRSAAGDTEARGGGGGEERRGG